MENEFKLLKEYLDIFIQLRVERERVPSFEYFKETYSDSRYSLSTPHYKESKNYYNGKLMKHHTTGLGTDDGIGYRFFNYWKGIKFFTGGNIHGEFTVTNKIQNVLKEI